MLRNYSSTVPDHTRYCMLVSSSSRIEGRMLSAEPERDGTLRVGGWHMAPWHRAGLGRTLFIRKCNFWAHCAGAKPATTSSHGRNRRKKREFLTKESPPVEPSIQSMTSAVQTRTSYSPVALVNFARDLKSPCSRTATIM